MTPDVPDYRPRFPDRPLRVAVLGAGAIAQKAHLPAYEKYGVEVAGVWSRTRETAERAREAFPSVGRIYGSPEELLADPGVDVVDLATRAEGREHWLAAAVDAGRHVLAQKPLVEDVTAVLPVLDRADAAGVRIAVNQNARWAPGWRLSTRLVQDGSIGHVVGVTHLHDKPLPPIAGTHFDDLAHMLLSDYLVHWVDITRCWLEGGRVEWLTAHDHRTPGQPDTAKNPWSASVEMVCADGASASIRVVGDVRTRTQSCPFWIHGTEGTIRGSLLGRDHVELERGETTTRYALEGEWFVDGFAGAMGELMCAVVEDREPYHSARNNLATLRLVDAARESASREGERIELGLAL